MKVEDNQLKAFILDAKIVTSKELDKADKEAEQKGVKLEDVLLSKNLVARSKLDILKAYILGVPFISLEKEKIEQEVLKIIPEQIAKQNNVIAFRKKDSELEIAMLDPQDLQTIELIKKKTGLKILPRITDKDSIKAAIKQYQQSLEEEFGKIIKKDVDESLKISQERSSDVQEDLKKAAEEAPIIKIVDTLIKHAILRNASDIHIEPTEKEVFVRYRIDGILRDAMVLPKNVHSGIAARIKVLSNLKLDEHRLPQDGRFKIETDDHKKVSFRVSILPIFDGEKIVMRLLPEEIQKFNLSLLGFMDSDIGKVERSIKKPNGMILVTGPTGSGKTTTLYTVLDILNDPGVNISTIEDPIEYRLPRINQTQVKPQIGFDFSSGLRSLVRQDPDIIMVGEIRDNETAALAVNAALTGHLVLSTLHTNSAAGAVPRLLDMKVEAFLLASTVNLIIAQRLVRTLCKDSREEYRLKKSEIEELEKQYDMARILNTLKQEQIIKEKDDWPDITFYKPKPSEECPDGYKGRVGIHEVLEVSDSIKELISQGVAMNKIEEQARKEGMKTMLEEGFIKALQGITTIEEVMRVSKE